jgi:hypothetical protein
VTASLAWLDILIKTATVLATLAPVVLLVLFAIDARKGRLW